jgi:catechol 2,3-dioxygenase-like lactoylglutathione lyase family enzyme
MAPHLRVARPVRDLARSVAMYTQGLGLHELGRFANHDGFDGVMLGRAGESWHFEFTLCRAHPVAPAPTAEDLLVFYVPDETAWSNTCRAMAAAGFRQVASFNPYWEQKGCTFEDHDGYRVVVQQAAWQNVEPEGG